MNADERGSEKQPIRRVVRGSGARGRGEGLDLLVRPQTELRSRGRECWVPGWAPRLRPCPPGEVRSPRGCCGRFPRRSFRLPIKHIQPPINADKRVVFNLLDQLCPPAGPPMTDNSITSIQMNILTTRVSTPRRG